MLKALNNSYLKVAGFVSATVLVNVPSIANAADVSGIIDNSTSEMENVPTLISWVAYLAGAGLGMAGIFKLRQHVDSPAQTPMKDGLVRLAASGALLSLPVIMSAMTDFVGGDNTASNSLPSLGPNGN